MFKSCQSEIFKSAPTRSFLLEFQRRKRKTDAQQIFVWDTKAIICPVSWEPIQHDLLKFIYKLMKTYHKCIQATVLGKVSSNNDICTRLPSQHTHIFTWRVPHSRFSKIKNVKVPFGMMTSLHAKREQPGAEGHPQLHPPYPALVCQKQIKLQVPISQSQKHRLGANQSNCFAGKNYPVMIDALFIH